MPNAVIVDAVRTPLGRRNGSLKDTHPVDLLAHVLDAVKEAGLPAIVVTGNALASVTMKTNSTSAADDTLVFLASSRGSHYLWDELFPTIDGTSATPFDATVTTTYWSHNAAEDVTVKVRILLNA